jgi:hypothetical protein
MNEEQSPLCIKAKLLAIREGIYITYVFQNMDNIKQYIMCTKCPNWNIPDFAIGMEGFLSYKFVQAGRDSWYSTKDMEFYPYQYTANYFQDFVPITHVINGDRIVEKEKLIIT